MHRAGVAVEGRLETLELLEDPFPAVSLAPVHGWALGDRCAHGSQQRCGVHLDSIASRRGEPGVAGQPAGVGRWLSVSQQTHLRGAPDGYRASRSGLGVVFDLVLDPLDRAGLMVGTRT